MPTPIEQQPFGPDLSHHNGPVNFAKMKRAGASFVILKCTQGTGFRDSAYNTNLVQAEAVGLLTGSYHYLSYEYDPVEQARFYARTHGPWHPGELGPIVDVENDDDDPETNKQYSAEFMTDYARRFVAEITRITGRAPILYTYPSFWNSTLGKPEGFNRCPLWVADYSFRRPRPTGDWPYHTFHQYTSIGTLAGNTGLDLNRFNGSIGGLRRMAGL